MTPGSARTRSASLIALASPGLIIFAAMLSPVSGYRATSVFRIHASAFFRVRNGPITCVLFMSSKTVKPFFVRETLYRLRSRPSGVRNVTVAYVGSVGLGGVGFGFFFVMVSLSYLSYSPACSSTVKVSSTSPMSGGDRHMQRVPPIRKGLHKARPHEHYHRLNDFLVVASLSQITGWITFFLGDQIFNRHFNFSL
jgi:hypothetical protein